MRVSVRPELLRWARDRAAPFVNDLYAKHTKLEEWIRGESQPTLKQLEDFAKDARVPIGTLFLPEPPAESLPIKDLRTVGGLSVRRASPDMLDTIYACQQRQDWYRDYATKHGLPKCPLVWIATLKTDPVRVADEITKVIDFAASERQLMSGVDEVFRAFRDRAEVAGILVMIGGTVGSNTRRPLNVDEFRGFALADEFAPVVFVNSTDSKVARMFTLAHEIAHLGLGESGVSNSPLNASTQDKIETWCNRVAAEFLVPSSALSLATDRHGMNADAIAAEFKVSRAVILRRLFDAGKITREDFEAAYVREVQRSMPKPVKEDAGGGNFYSTLRLRVSPKFAEAVISSTTEGETLYTDAFRLLEVKNVKTLNALGETMGLGR